MTLQRFAREFNEALKIAWPGWNSDISRWHCIFFVGIRTNMEDNFFIVLIFEIQSFIFVFTIFKIYYWFRKLQVCVWLFSFDFVLSWNGKQLVHPICTLSILCCTFLDLHCEIFMLTTYIASVGCLLSWEWSWKIHCWYCVRKS